MASSNNGPTTTTSAAPTTAVGEKSLMSAPRPPSNTNIAPAANTAATAASSRMITEDERRMKFLALLCGSGAFPHTNLDGANNNNNDRMIHDHRQRSGSVSSIGKVMVEGSGVIVNNKDGSAMEIESSVDNTKNGKLASASAAAAKVTIPNDEPNYTPTTPHNLSRRILHKSSVGYLDDSVPLLTSALSDRFLATVLVQAMACRDRRIEGYKATLRQRKRRLRHKKRVAREKSLRDEKTMQKLKMKGVGDDYGKMAEDVDREEEYYDNYFGEKGDEEGENEEYISEDDDEDEDDDDDELIDESQYDLKLRDLVRPLSAWGFDLTGKMGFNNDDEGDIDRKLQDDEYDSASDGEDLDDEEENDDGENPDESDNDLMTDDEVTGKKSTSSSPKKKKKATQTKAKKSATTATTKKKAATAKRKRDEEEGGNGKDGKEEENPKKKVATNDKKPAASDNK